jgi:hypothetical protein
MTDTAISPLRRRMIEDMTIRQFRPMTQHNYVRFVKDFSIFFGRSPDKATFEVGSQRRGLLLSPSSSGAGTLACDVRWLRVPAESQTRSDLQPMDLGDMDRGGGRDVLMVEANGAALTYRIRRKSGILNCYRRLWMRTTQSPPPHFLRSSNAQRKRIFW